MKIRKNDLYLGIFFIMCILINYGGKTFCVKYNLPIWLDSVGTVLAAYAAGPVCGGIIGSSVNLMMITKDINSVPYAAINLIVGVVSGILIKKRDFLSKIFNTYSLGMILALTSSILSLPINIAIYNGYTGNVWGDAVINDLTEIGFNPYLSYFAGEFCVDMLNSLVSVFIIYILVKIYSGGVSGIKKFPVKKNIATLMIIVLSGSFIAASTDAYGQGISSGKDIESEVSVSSVTQNSGKSIDFSSYVQTTYDDGDGILGGMVNDIAQTSDGMLWIGTYGGLYQYDGNQFQFKSNFDSVRNVNCFYTDEEGRLWIGTNDCGLSICANNNIVNVLDESKGLAANSVRSITKSSDGYYYVGTAEALDIVVLVDGISIIHEYAEMNYVQSLASDENGYVCAIDVKGEIGIFRGEELLHLYSNSETGEKYTSAAFDNYGNLLVSTSDNKVEKYNIDNGELIKTDEYSCGDLKVINSIYVDSNDIIFVCADNGIGQIDSLGTCDKVNTGDFNSCIENVLVDYQGNYWLSSSRQGLLKLCKSDFNEIFPRAGMDEAVVNVVTKWNGDYYIGTDSGLMLVDETLSIQKHNDLEELLKGIRLRSMAVDYDNSLWIATSSNGVYRLYTDGSYDNFGKDNGLPSMKTRSVLLLKNGDIAVSSDAGVSIIRNGKVEENYTSNDGFATAKTLCLYEHGHTLYCGTDGGGIAVIEDGKIVKLIRKSDGLSSDIILRMVEDSEKEGFYVVTSNGINYISYNGYIKNLSKFPYYNNYDIVLNNDGKAWITSSAGIYIVDENQLKSGGDVDYELLDSKRGLRQELVANSWNYHDNDGNLILCGDEGLVYINTGDYNRLHSSYRIMLETVALDDVEVSVDKEETNTIGRDVVRVEFFPKIINYSTYDPYVSIYLDGFDSQPKVMLQSELENVVYTNLKAGTYTFSIAILDSKQETEIEKVSYVFTKEKELYDNWWFVLYLFFIVMLVVIYLVWLIVGTQINNGLKIQRKELENLRLKQTADAAVAAGAAKDRFLALMSHDIRTPINAILGMNEMVLRESHEREIYDYARDIKSAGDTLLSLVNSILDLSKIEEGKMEILPVHYDTRELLNNIINGCKGRAENKGLKFICSIDESLPEEMCGDDVRINQVVSNILTNAVKYTREGSVTFTVRKESVEGEKVNIFFEVKDTGIGIKKEDMGRLFESFQRLDENKNRNIEGTGLGMTIVMSLLTLMGSELVVDSDYGKGSTFSFVLSQRIISEKPMGKLAQKKQEIYDRASEEHLYAPYAKILVVDDSEMNLRVAEGLLKINGIKPDVATSGMEAVKKAATREYDIIFMDHMMPEMDGIQTLHKMHELRALTARTKVIVLTANALNGAKEMYINSGFDDFMAKPIDAAELENKLKQHLRKELILTTERLDKTPVVEGTADYKNGTKENSIDNADEVSDSKLADDSNSTDVDSEVGMADERIVRLKQLCPAINIENGLKYCMNSWEFYEEIMQAFVGEYYERDRLSKLEKHYTDRNWSEYRVIIHAIKSASLSLGADEISLDAKALEQAAKNEEEDYLIAEHSAFIERFRAMLTGLVAYFNEEDEAR